MKLLLVLVLSLVAVASSAQTLPPIRGTHDGYVVGSRQGNVVSFKGIPYAQPPLVDLRWKPPQAPTPWAGLRDATAFGKKCKQPTYDKATGAVTGVDRASDEDCLTLNVWAPAGIIANPLPVLFFIHGGNYVNGSASDATADANGVLHYSYDGSYLAEHGPAVVVSLDYRLGVFGFVAHKTMEGESEGFGNYGALDTIQALKWVQQNIANFGGDPARVMMFGHSAGAFMSCTLMASPKARGLFSRVIMESGGCEVYPRSLTEAMGDQLATNLGCADSPDVPACLRAADANSVAIALKPSYLRGTDGVTYRPNIDGALLTESPEDSFRAGTYTHVPLILTGTQAEFSQTLSPYYIGPRPTTEAEYRADVELLIGKMHLGRATVDEVMARYPFPTQIPPYWGLVALTTDVALTGSRRIAREVSASQSEPVRRGHFWGGLDNGPRAGSGAFHGIDIAYVFRTFTAAFGDTPTPTELAISDAVIGYWTRFAATGDPNGGGAVNWPQFDAVTDPFLALGPVIGSGTGLHSANCDYWESVLY
jgi:para-nitrobenzyl esterase